MTTLRMVPITFTACGETSMATGVKTYWGNTIGTPPTINRRMSTQVSTKYLPNCERQKTEAPEDGDQNIASQSHYLIRTAYRDVMKMFTGRSWGSCVRSTTPNHFAGTLRART